MSNFSKTAFVYLLVTALLLCTTGYIHGFVPISVSSSSNKGCTTARRQQGTSGCLYLLPVPTATVAAAISEQTPRDVVLLSAFTKSPSNLLMDESVRAYTTRGVAVVDTVTSPLSSSSASISSSTSLLSLQEIKKVTKEELEQKKMTFNIIFWGGGVIAPFIATVFYFGFKFWEK